MGGGSAPCGLESNITSLPLTSVICKAISRKSAETFFFFYSVDPFSYVFFIFPVSFTVSRARFFAPTNFVEIKFQGNAENNARLTNIVCSKR